MKRIFVVGAGQSSPYLIRWLLDRAESRDWQVTVGDVDLGLAESRVAGHPRGRAIFFDVSDPQERGRLFDEAEIVVNLLPPRFELPVAWTGVEHGTPVVTASYMDARVAALDAEARARGVLLLAEMGLDPGIDLMSTMRLLEAIRREGGRVVSYESYGSGVPDPEAVDNPFRYAITWNPRNVVMAGQEGAMFLRDGRLRVVPALRLFRTTWPVAVDGIGTMEAYPNRDSLRYTTRFGLEGCPTVIRGTLRFPGWCETWHQVVRLGLPLETLVVPGLEEMTWRQLVTAVLPDDASDAPADGPGAPADLEDRVAGYLGLDRDAPVMARLRWLGLFSDAPVDGRARTPSEALVALLRSRLRLPEGGRDLVILLHRLVYERPDGRRSEVVSTLREWGEPGGPTAMARTVGLPMALAVDRILSGEIGLTGAHIPTRPEIYDPILDALTGEGIRFDERWTDETNRPEL